MARQRLTLYFHSRLKHIATCLLLFASFAHADALQPLVNRFYAARAQSGVDVVQTRGYVDTLRDDGTWPDIVYESNEYMSWPIAAHVRRVEQMARAYRNPGELHDDPQVLAAVHLSLKTWRDKAIVARNWYWNEIGVNMQLAPALLLIKDKLTPEEIEQARAILARKTINRAGQNGVWAAEIDLYCGLVLSDEAVVRKSIGTVFGLFKLGAKEGLQADMSFQQHGPQLQFGNYGGGYADTISRWLDLITKTPFESMCGDEQKKAFRRYLLEGYSMIVWKGVMDYSALGRQIGRTSEDGKAGPASKAKGVNSVLERMSRLDPKSAGEYRKRIDSNREGQANKVDFSRVYYATDFALHRRPTFYSSVRMNSPRVVPGEHSETENRSGWYFGDGAMYVMRSGKEYLDVIAAWDWRKVPGTTCAQSGPTPKIGERNKADFVGGVDDGLNSAVIYTQDKAGVRARKATFYVGDQILCLGAGIESDGEAPIVSTFEQSRLNGPVRLFDKDGSSILPRGTHDLSSAAAIEHAGIRYVFPESMPLKLEAAARAGDWNAVNVNSADESVPVNEDVFLLYVDHGAKPSAAAYSLLILPADGEKPTTLDAAKVKITANTPTLQSATFAALSRTCAIFHAAGETKSFRDRAIKIDHPCALMIDESKDVAVAYVSDPTHKLKTATLTYDGREYAIEFAEDEYAGQTVRLELKS